MKRDNLPAASSTCPHSTRAAAYVKCTLPQTESNFFQEHFNTCEYCTHALATVIESGIEPVWLSEYRKQKQLPTTPETALPLISEIPLPEKLKTESLSPRYEFVRLCGAGGMGQVWEGWDSVMRRRVALKQLHTELQQELLDQRLFQEAASLARLSHPNIVSVFEVFMLQDRLTMVMEFVPGPSLSQVRGEFAMAERQAAGIVLKLAQAVAHAHQRGVIHRDLKPANVLLYWPTEEQANSQDLDRAIPKLTDFGLAKVATGNRLTRTGEMIGTPSYMAPEQTLGDGQTSAPSVDIYGLGAVLYDLLTGTPPHVGENPLATLLAVREREPVAPSVLRPKLSQDLETICLKCLQKLPQNRYANVTDLCDDLNAFLDGRAIRARPPSLLYRANCWARRHKSATFALGFSALLFFTVVLGSLWAAKNERALREVAEKARQQAKQSDELAQIDSRRANQTLADIQEHFKVTLNQIEELANQSYTRDDIELERMIRRQEINDLMQLVYAGYLKTLPDPAQWSFAETIAVAYYVYLAPTLKLPETAYLPWLGKLHSVVPRIQREFSDESSLFELLVWYHTGLAVHAVNIQDFRNAGVHREAAANAFRLPIDAGGADLHVHRMYATFLMDAAQPYMDASCHRDALRVTTQALAGYRKVLELSAHAPEDRSHFLGLLLTHRKVRSQLQCLCPENDFRAEFFTIAATFQEDSPFFHEVQESIRQFNAIDQ